MRKYGLILVFALLLSSCYTSTSQQTAGTMTGAMIGNSVGSLFGGLADGSRGTWWGSAVGTIAGAAIGNAINTQKKTSRSMEKVPPESYAAIPQESAPLNLMQQLDIRNIKFVDENHDLKINPQERCQLIFEIYNVGAQSVTNIIPSATVSSQEKHIFMSQPALIDRIAPGEGLRYTLSVYADKGLRTGNITFNLYLAADGQKRELVRTFELSCENPDKR